MATTTYFTVEGEILGEDRAGTKRDYVPDPLGSVRALLNSSQSQTDTYSYWPYGETQASTGSSANPMRFIGSLGGRHDHANRSYFRVRELEKRCSRWLTVDPLWPRSRAYDLAWGNPVSYADPTGMDPPIPAPGPGVNRYALPYGFDYLTNCCEALTKSLPGNFYWFKRMVQTGGPWDYKHGKPPFEYGFYQPVGNFHYGYMAACAGIPLEFALRAAGWAQIGSGTSQRGWGDPFGDPPYGDDPYDQLLIRAGWLEAAGQLASLKCQCAEMGYAVIGK